MARNAVYAAGVSRILFDGLRGKEEGRAGSGRYSSWRCDRTLRALE